MTISNIIFSCLAGIIGSMGMGSGTVLIIYLTIFLNYEQTKAQGINLLFFLPCAIYSIVTYLRYGMINKKPLAKLILSGIIGACAGYAVLNLMPTELLGKLFGGFLVLIALNEIFNFKSKPKTPMLEP